MQTGTSHANWSVDSTRAAIGVGNVQTGLEYLKDNSIATRADSYLWRLEFNAAYQEFEQQLAVVRSCMAELNQLKGSAAFSRSSRQFVNAAPRLIADLDYIRKLVIDEFPAISDAISA
jgi:hypothetical protein